MIAWSAGLSLFSDVMDSSVSKKWVKQEEKLGESLSTGGFWDGT